MGDNLDKHLNLVNMVAACTKNYQRGQIWLLLEFCPHGDLKKLLAKHRSALKDSLKDQRPILAGFDAAKLFIKWGCEIAKGMEYLFSKNVMHGDLAARNILIGGPEGYFIAKIADFGLSKTFYDLNYRYKKKEHSRDVPLKYMDIGHLKFSELKLTSDIWSFGVVLWEIFSLGEEPYGRENEQCLIERIIGGYRLPCPEKVSDIKNLQELYEKITTSCWKEKHSDRWDFTEIAKCFNRYRSKHEVEESISIEEEFKLKVSAADATTLQKRGNSNNPQNYVVEISLMPLKIAKNLWARMKYSVHCCKTDQCSEPSTTVPQEPQIEGSRRIIIEQLDYLSVSVNRDGTLNIENANDNIVTTEDTNANPERLSLAQTDQAMPIPVGPGGEVKYSREDIQKLAANGANIYAGEPEDGPKNGPGK